LPNDLKGESVAWLPVENLCRYCCVCEEWNTLFLSRKFICDDWVAAPPNKKSWLVLWNDISLNFMAYCFFTNTSKKFSFAFLQEKYDVEALENHRSAASLFLLSIVSLKHTVFRHIVSNPLTATSFELPRINDRAIWGMTIVAAEGEGHNGETYKVIAITGNEQRVQIYDSVLNMWSTAGHVRNNLGVS